MDRRKFGSRCIPATISSVLFFCAFSLAQASPGTEGASFLDIPIGGRPAAMGSAYSALAEDAYAPTWNPAGLGFLDFTRMAFMHLAYLSSVSYEYFSFAHPLTPGSSLGASIQYLRPGEINAMDINGNPAGSASGYYGAYSLAYGMALGGKFSLGLTGKIVDARISDVSARAYAADIGSMYKFNERITLALVASNIGSRLTFINQADSLPLNFRLGGVYRTDKRLDLALEALYQRTGLAGIRLGAEWRLLQALSLRAGYRTETTQGLSLTAGFSTGLGLQLWGQEFDYAWLPMGDLGATQYFSLAVRFGRPNAAQAAAPTYFASHDASY